MKKTFVSLLFVILPFLGLFDSGYVTYEIFADRVPVCTPPFQCAAFLQNDWAYIAGLPLSVYGFIFYTIVLALAIMNFLEIKNVKKALRGLATFGFLFAFYVTVLMAFVVKYWCLWCLVSVIILSILFINSRFLTDTEKPLVEEEK